MAGRALSVIVAALVTVTVAAADCSGRPPVPARPSAAPTAAPPPGGCAGGPRLEEGRHTIEFAGLKRVFLLALPDGDGPHPVLLNLHGLGSNAREQAAYSRLPRVGAGRGYIVATPQVAKDRFAWTLPNGLGPDDTGFLGALLDRLEQRLCVDRRREFAAGLSYGGGMAAALACGLEGRLAGVAVVGGLSLVTPCPDPPPVTLVAFHGTADRAVPYGGGHPLRDSTGDLRKLADMVTLPPVPRTAEGWAAALGCPQPVVSSPVRSVRLRAWDGCEQGAAVRLYTIDGGGHTWPGPIEVPRLGATVRGLDATALILDAFDSAQPR
ncbi:alpha/beta hydrolase family esterase [Nonomuraea sp. NPDC048826]|uniref:alpha/beta hydrolase family esterase n=1 Tax=Nonomuraea sp. NPDC048826 TaxID=3364347 RepID=UPI00371780CF